MINGLFAFDARCGGSTEEAEDSRSQRLFVRFFRRGLGFRWNCAMRLGRGSLFDFLVRGPELELFVAEGGWA